MIEIWECFVLAFLVVMSGLFSGLNLGLMGLDPVGLDIVMSGAEPNRTYAANIKPIRDKGNWLLCTLLLGNVAVNAYLSILLADITSGMVGFISSTALIVVFGEIIPQAVCSRYALRIGNYTVYIVIILMIIISPLAYPISMILDWVLGDELGTIYTNKELERLVQIHAQHEGTNISQRAADVLRGVLGLKDRKVSEIMTRMEDVFYLLDDTKLTFDILTDVFKSGHSRIPIVAQIDEGRLKIVGILYVKDLILIDPDDEIMVTRIMSAFGHVMPPTVFADMTLETALQVFMKAKQHLAIVKSVSEVEGGNKDRVYDYVGIVTLEDVIEHILQTQLVDEHDNFEDRRHKKKTGRLSRIDWNLLQMFDHRGGKNNNLPPQELQAVHHFLSQSIRVFTPQHRVCSEKSIKNLLQCSKVIRVIVSGTDKNEHASTGNIFGNDKKSGSANNSQNNLIPFAQSQLARSTQRDPYRDIENNGLLLYQRDVKTEYFTLLLDGKCEIFAGKQGFRSELHRWSYLCPDALEHVQTCHVRKRPLIDYVADFTCKIVENSRVLRVSLRDFKACLEGRFENIAEPDGLPPRNTTQAVSAPQVLSSPGATSEQMTTRFTLGSFPDIQSSTGALQMAELQYGYGDSPNASPAVQPIASTALQSSATVPMHASVSFGAAAPVASASSASPSKRDINSGALNASHKAPLVQRSKSAAHMFQSPHESADQTRPTFIMQQTPYGLVSVPYSGQPMFVGAPQHRQPSQQMYQLPPGAGGHPQYAMMAPPPQHPIYHPNAATVAATATPIYSQRSASLHSDNDALHTPTQPTGIVIAEPPSRQQRVISRSESDPPNPEFVQRTPSEDSDNIDENALERKGLLTEDTDKPPKVIDSADVSIAIQN